MSNAHVPVLLEPALEGLAIKEDGIYVDGTFGRGGHSSAILERLGKEGISEQYTSCIPMVAL